jgi:hypothetical protein
MAFCSKICCTVIALLACYCVGASCSAQVFIVGEKSATADVSTDFHPTRVELSTAPITERGRRELLRNLVAEQGFAHRALPLGESLVLLANGNLNPSGEAYKQMLYKKGESAAPGDRVEITSLVIKGDRIVFDLNGGPYLKHRFLRHIQIDDNPLAADDGDQVTGCRIALVFEGGIPDISAPEVKALLDPLIDFGVKTAPEAYADTLPQFLKDAVARHDVLVGMNRKMVLATMGAPISKVRELVDGSKDRHYEEWIYGQSPQTVRFIRFIGDRVVQVRTAALGQPIAVRAKNEMRGYLDPEDTHEIAMGDDRPGSGDSGPTKAPTILKPGEVAPGGSQQVQMPVAHRPPVAGTSDPVGTGTAAPSEQTQASSPASNLIAASDR